MAGSVNKVILVGNVGKDPETRTFNNGGKVCNFSLATSETWRDKQSGEKRESTQWHNIAIFNENLVKVVENYVKKGTKLYLEGQLQTRKWQDRDGNDRWTTEVVLQRFRGELVLLDSRGSGGGGGGGYNQDSVAYGNQGQDRNIGGGGGSRSATSQDGPKENFDMDDEIPF